MTVILFKHQFIKRDLKNIMKQQKEPDIMNIRLLKYPRIKTIISQLCRGSFLQIFFLNVFYRQSSL